MASRRSTSEVSFPWLSDDKGHGGRASGNSARVLHSHAGLDHFPLTQRLTSPCRHSYTLMAGPRPS